MLILFIRLYFLGLITFLLIDSIWLSTMIPRFYKKYLSHILADSPNFFAAGVFYIIFVFGITYFVLLPAEQQSLSLIQILIRGAIFGGICYATYDLTSQAVVKNWPTILSIIDILWGMILTGSVSIIVIYLFRSFFS